MNCYAHHSESSVSTCQKCGRGLCPECTDKHTLPICDKCAATTKKAASNVKKSNKTSIVFELIVTFAAGMIAMFFFKGEAEASLSPNDGVFLRQLTLWIPFIIAAGVVSILFMYSEYKSNKPPSNKVKVTVYKDSSMGCIGSLVKYLIIFIVAGSIGPYVFPFRTIYNFWRLIK